MTDFDYSVISFTLALIFISMNDEAFASGDDLITDISDHLVQF